MALKSHNSPQPPLTLRGGFHFYQDFTAHLADREYFGQKLGLERIQALLGRLGNPERKFKSIHIAGTNGKGSTAAMIASILREGGYRVGLYTSPHLVDFCERVQIFGAGDSGRAPAGTEFMSTGGRNPRQDPPHIKKDQVLHYAREIREVETEPLTFFELATAIGFLHFAEEKVDIAVIEVGLGGRLDATNVISPLVSVITTIGLDHMQYLGDTIEKIAGEKAGIIKPGVPVIVGDLPEEAMGVVRKIAGERVLPLLTPTRRHRPPSSDCWRSVGGPQSGHPFASNLPSPPGGRGGTPPLVGGDVPKGQGGRSGGEGEVALAGTHQLHNAAVAVSVIEELQRQGWKIGDEEVRLGLANVRWPGRLETVQEQPWVLLDGAHNPQAMRAVRMFLEANLNGRRLRVLFGAMADKDLQGILAEIAPLTEEFIFTAPQMKRAAGPEQLAKIGSMLGRNHQVIAGVTDAIQTAMGRLQNDEVLLITGSCYVVGEARQWFGR